eukprot:gene25865-biopygen1491
MRLPETPLAAARPQRHRRWRCQPSPRQAMAGVGSGVGAVGGLPLSCLRESLSPRWQSRRSGITSRAGAHLNSG